MCAGVSGTVAIMDPLDLAFAAATQLAKAAAAVAVVAAAPGPGPAAAELPTQIPRPTWQQLQAGAGELLDDGNDEIHEVEVQKLLAPRGELPQPSIFPDFSSSLTYTGNFNWWLHQLHNTALHFNLVPTILSNFNNNSVQGLRYGSDCWGRWAMAWLVFTWIQHGTNIPGAMRA